MTAATQPQTLTVAAAVAKFWGYTELKPLQAEAIQAGIDGEDSLVVLPTGGGKSLCYQVPPAVTDRLDIVVSPLIALMKDQVDALRACGYPAAAIHSGLGDVERRQIPADMAAGRLNIVFVSPERLLTPWFIAMAKKARVRNFAIDEAHCISQWGHDFRPEYRRLAELREHFPEAGLHAFTATATERVRRDIIDQLKLRRPKVLVGRFDRPNLSYHILPRTNIDAQIVETLRRHDREAAIVYCISRKDTEAVAEMLKAAGFRAAAYHAGMESRDRTRVQDAFARERLDVVVATVAFGMGIDRSNIRCVIHAAMPKSIEHYQQETGRAGRDGLPAECVMFYGANDSGRWERLLTRSAAETGQPEHVTRAQIDLVRQMNAFCGARSCRHRALSAYFGQGYEGDGCGACDVCTSGAPVLEDATDVARQIIECVQALRLPFGVGYVAEVLAGAKLEKIRARRHDRLAQYGTMSDLGRGAVQQLILQLVELDLLDRSSGERPVLTLTETGRRFLKGGLEVKLRAPEPARVERPASTDEWQGPERDLFEALRTLRRQIAEERSVPSYVIFSDTTLRDLAVQRPVTLGALLNVKGVGERKQADYGARFVELIAGFCRQHKLSSQSQAKMPSTASLASARSEAFRLFDQRRSLDEIARSTGRARGTISNYLEEYIDERRPDSIETWVPAALYTRIKTVAIRLQSHLLKPVFEAMNGEVPYEEIRLVMKHAGLR
jgi:ATP-dependent DNA helicase RecQ